MEAEAGAPPPCVVATKSNPMPSRTAPRPPWCNHAIRGGGWLAPARAGRSEKEHHRHLQGSA